MTNLNQLLEETFDRLTVDMTPAEMLDTYEKDEFAEALSDVWGDFDDVRHDLPIEFDSWADVADAMFEWARTLS